jgi:hypothetical protein
MIKVVIPGNFLPEREYIVNTMMAQFLGLDITIQADEASEDYTIELPGGNRLVFRDFFWGNKTETEGYLNVGSIPDDVFFAANDFLSEADIPVIYGTDDLEINNDIITCGIGIFASSFFMLTRWEEYAAAERDAHDRFPGGSALSCKFNFINRPVVNEYVEMLWNMMLKLGADEKWRKPGHFEIIPTHDVDRVYFNNQFKKIFGDVFIDFKPQNAVKRIYYDLKRDNKYDTFNWLMEISEKNNLTSRFYFLSDGLPKEDRGFLLRDKFITQLKEKIISRGHILGFHPGYDTYNDIGEWVRQKKLLEDTFNVSLSEGRQHFLRMAVPATLQVWEDNGMVTDSTLGYSSQAGFRCGTANEFSMFNAVTRKSMTLKERPLIFMDETFRQRKKPAESLDNARKAMNYYKAVCKKYDMPLTILFHNNNLEPLRWKGWKEFYENEVMA